jgi:hypothetical protein
MTKILKENVESLLWIICGLLFIVFLLGAITGAAGKDCKIKSIAGKTFFTHHLGCKFAEPIKE